MSHQELEQLKTGEDPRITLQRFFESDSWKKADIDREYLTSQFVSVSDESNGRPNFNYIEVRNGVLFDPESNEPVLKLIQKRNQLEAREFYAAEQLQDWAASVETGIGLWISARYEGEYPKEKVVIYRIAHVMDPDFDILRKVIVTSTIRFDGQIKDPEVLRQTLLTFDDSEDHIFGILNWISEKSDEFELKNADAMEIRNQASHYVDMFLSGISRDRILEDMQRTRFLGEDPLSCPGGGQSFMDFTDSHSSKIDHVKPGWKEGICRKCKRYTSVGGCSICEKCVLMYYSNN